MRTVVEIIENIIASKRFNHCWLYVAVDLFVEVDNAVNYPATFQGRYFQEGIDASRSNPNLGVLERLIDDSRKVILESLESGCCKKDSLEVIEELYCDLELQDYYDENGNQATLLWSLISAIDLAYSEWSKTSILSRRGPWYSSRWSNIGVYIGPVRGFAQPELEKLNIEPMNENCWNNYLSALQFYKNDSSNDFPEIALLRESENESSSNTIENKLRIGICTFGSFKLLEEGDAPIRLNRFGGGLFCLEYRDDYDLLVWPRIEKAISQSIEHGCQIVLFPKYTLSPSLVGRLRELLRQIEDAERLRIVVAGSSWIGLNNDVGCNVCNILGAQGVEAGNVLGAIKKKEPFQSSSGRLIEGLKDDSASTFILDVQGIGRIMFAICKDVVSASGQFSGLAKMFTPQVICIPAYSPSLDRAFKSQLNMFARNTFSVSIVCNACSARRDSKEKSIDTSLIGYLEAKKQYEGVYRPKPNTKRLECLATRFDSCRKSTHYGEGGCLYVIDIDYSKESSSGGFPYVESNQINLE